jgi:hypothetical protein
MKIKCYELVIISIHDEDLVSSVVPPLDWKIQHHVEAGLQV